MSGMSRNREGLIMEVDENGLLSPESIDKVRFQVSFSKGVGKDEVGNYRVSEYTISRLIDELLKAQRDITRRDTIKMKG